MHAESKFFILSPTLVFSFVFNSSLKSWNEMVSPDLICVFMIGDVDHFCVYSLILGTQKGMCVCVVCVYVVYRCLQVCIFVHVCVKARGHYQVSSS